MAVDNQEYYTVQEVADILKIHYNTVYGMIKDGRLRHLTIGTTYRIPKTALRDLENSDIKDTN